MILAFHITLRHCIMKRKRSHCIQLISLPFMETFITTQSILVQLYYKDNHPFPIIRFIIFTQRDTVIVVNPSFVYRMTIRGDLCDEVGLFIIAGLHDLITDWPTFFTTRVYFRYILMTDENNLLKGCLLKQR